MPGVLGRNTIWLRIQAFCLALVWPSRIYRFILYSGFIPISSQMPMTVNLVITISDCDNNGTLTLAIHHERLSTQMASIRKISVACVVTARLLIQSGGVLALQLLGHFVCQYGAITDWYTQRLTTGSSSKHVMAVSCGSMHCAQLRLLTVVSALSVACTPAPRVYP